MIISGGFNIIADIEVLLLKNPDVIDVAVIGNSQRSAGQSPMALLRAPGLVRPPGGRDPRLGEWRAGQKPSARCRGAT